jgi:hypothetical protein
MVHKTASEQEHVILTTLYLAGVKNTDTLDELIDNKKHKFQVWIQNAMKHSKKTKKAKKNSRRSSRRGKSHKTNKRHEKWLTKEKSKENLKIKIERVRRAQNWKK